MAIETLHRPDLAAPGGPGSIRFLLNEALVETTEPGGLALLDFVRRRRELKGTKEGCKEGDCGACTVLVGELEGERVRYRPMTSCLMPLAEAHGRHVVTVEGIDVGRPNALQRAIVDHGASQCGFCTPGIAVSFAAMVLEGEGEGEAGGTSTPEDRVLRALSGHLCRCTGYRSLRSAGLAGLEALGIGVNGMPGLAELVAQGELPGHFLAAADRLRGIASRPVPADAAVVAGGTDLYVQRGEELPDGPVATLHALLPRRPELRGVRVADGWISIGALTSFEEIGESELLRRRIPGLRAFLDLVASWQIRTRATVAGNLVNASPIGDLTVLLLALGARVVLERGAFGDGGESREVPLDGFYRGYKVLDRARDEIVTEVRVPEIETADRVDFEKVSKRRYLDIATVNTAARLRVEDGEIVAARLAAGGVAPIPLFLRQASAAVVGRPVAPETVARAVAVAQEEISPISDVRGSAEYKRLLVRNLLVAHFTNLFPERLAPEALLA
jgi:xanthine dehydrogenase small subunit